MLELLIAKKKLTFIALPVALAAGTLAGQQSSATMLNKIGFVARDVIAAGASYQLRVRALSNRGDVEAEMSSRLDAHMLSLTLPAQRFNIY